MIRTGSAAKPGKRLKRPDGTARRNAIRLAAWGLAGALLSCARLGSVCLPAGVCLIAALGSGKPALAVWFGSFAGLLLPVPREFPVFSVSAGLLTLTAVWTVREWIAGKPDLRAPLIAGVPSLLIAGLICAADGMTVGGMLPWLLCAVLSVPGTAAAKKWLRRPNSGVRALAVFAAVSGAAAIPPLGAAVAAAAVTFLLDTDAALPAAVLSGMALDCIGMGASATAALAAGAAAARACPGWRRGLRYWPFLAVYSACILFSGTGGSVLFLSGAAGAAVGLLLPPPEPEPVPEEDRSQERKLRLAASAMEEMYRQLDDAPAPEPDTAVAQVFDRAACRVCNRCAKYSPCWKHGEKPAYRAFCEAAPALWARRKTEASDFPPGFLEQCRHPAALMKAIDDAIGDFAAERQRQHRRNEFRSAAAMQYRILADYLRAVPREPALAPRFTVEAACRAQGRGGDPVTGDRTAWFRCGNCFCMMLCDGMGTGTEAAEDSRRAVGLLSRLLRSGMDPDDALESLNLLSVLREDGGFATVDLIRADLETGEATLYRLGSGCCWLLRGARLMKIGTAAFPPGLGVGGTLEAQRVRLSLGNGEVLVLTSDGVDGEEAGRRIRLSREETARELAEGILAQGTGIGEDDRMAAVLRLHPVSVRA